MNTPIFVLSLKNSADRRAKISARLSELGLSFSFIDALPVKELARPEWAQLIDRDGAAKTARKQMAETEFSASLSHALIYKKIIDENHPYAFILEDDAILSEDFATMVSDRTFENSGEDFVNFFYGGARVLKKLKKQIGHGYTLRKLVKPCSYAVGYFLSQRGARFMWEDSIPIHDVPDWGADITRIDAKIISPRLVGHPKEENVPSTLTGRELPGKLSLINRLNGKYIRYLFQKPFSELIE